MANIIPEDGVRFSDPDDLNTQVREYLKVKQTLDAMTTRQKELRDKLFAKLDEEGYEDDKGNVQLELDSEIDGVLRIEKQRRVTRKLDELKADEIIAANQLEDTLYKVVRVVDEEALMAAYYEGKISEAELDEMFPANVVWALMTKKK